MVLGARPHGHQDGTRTAPYVKPQRDKVFCDRCNERPEGFRTAGALRKHINRVHAEERTVWVCVNPSATSAEGWQPKQPINTCEPCLNKKEYNIDDNAADHLRRIHFCPLKLARKVGGEECESRAGGIDDVWPPKVWLKDNGWLRGIKIHSTKQDLAIHNYEDFRDDSTCNDFNKSNEGDPLSYDPTLLDPKTEECYLNTTTDQLDLTLNYPEMWMDLYEYPTTPMHMQQQQPLWSHHVQMQQQMCLPLSVQAPHTKTGEQYLCNFFQTGQTNSIPQIDVNQCMLARLSDADHSDAHELLSGAVLPFQVIQSIVELMDESWEMVILKAHRWNVQEMFRKALPGSNVDLEYNPVEPTDGEVRDWGEWARVLHELSFRQRAASVMKEGGPVAAAYYAQLLASIDLRRAAA